MFSAGFRRRNHLHFVGWVLNRRSFFLAPISQDFDGEYFEIGYADTLSIGATDVFDYTFSIIRSSDELSGNTTAGQPDEDTF